MSKFLKPGKICILLHGRYAGHKAVIVRTYHDGSPDRPYPHALVAGINRAPLRVTRDMGKKKIAKRSRVKPFVKAVNYQHLMPTRYTFDSGNAEVKTLVTADSVVKEKRRKAVRNVRRVFQERYNAGKQKWLFRRLRF